MKRYHGQLPPLCNYKTQDNNLNTTTVTNVDGFIAPLVEHRIGNAKAMGSNPGLILQLLKLLHNCDDLIFHSHCAKIPIVVMLNFII